MRGRLFWRMFFAFSVAMLMVVALFTGILSATLQRVNQGSYESEVLGQAREVASYMDYMSQLSFISSNATARHFLQEKLNMLRDNYDASIWLVSYSSGTVQCLDSNLNTSEVAMSEPVMALLNTIRTGQEVRVQGIFQELGSEIVTIGVPWMYGEKVIGAVLLHISVESLRVNYSTVLRTILPIAGAAMLAGVAASWFVARGQSRPLRQLSRAMQAFGRGQQDSRVSLCCGGEMQELGESFNRMADELARQEESRKNFVANVSHELRSPLTSMRGYVQAMLDGTIDGENMHKYLRVVMDETVRLTDLVRDLLDLSRFESGKFPLNRSAFDMSEVLRRTLINYEQRIERKNIEVEADFPDDPAYVEADVNRISQVVGNIVDNAVKFLPDEGGKLSLGVKRESGGVDVWVTDNGAGISPQDLPHVFERFYKADKAHTAGMGTGLGLAICQKIMEQHGSKIVASSVPGATTFSFHLPAGTPPERARALPQPETES